MNKLFYLLTFGILMKICHGGMLGIPNPIKVAQQIGNATSVHSASALGQLQQGIKKAADATKAVDEKVYQGGKGFVHNIHKGVFDIEKGFVDGVDEVVGTPVNLEELTFSLVTAKNLDHPQKINFYKPDDVAATKGKIYFLIHGWRASMNSSWFHDLSEIFIKREPDTHVVQVDWSGPATDNYAFSAFDTESIGEYVGTLINNLVNNYKVPLKNIVLIGHSLGGQISGWAGKYLQKLSGQRLPRIVALDPAGPLFLLRPESRRLNKHDADVVQVVHSDGGKLGYPSSIGTIDFFPNGGSNQPGCWSVNLGQISTYLEPVTCDHSRAWDFYVEAINHTDSFPSRKCDSYSHFEKGKCDNNPIVAMGNLETTETGKFFLRTNSTRPYSILLQQVIEGIQSGIEEIKDKIDEVQNKPNENQEQKNPSEGISKDKKNLELNINGQSVNQAHSSGL